MTVRKDLLTPIIMVWLKIQINLFIVLSIFLILFFPKNANAEFTFTLNKTNITEDEEILATVLLSVSGQNNKTYYLEGSIKEETGSNYFGLTWNDSSWAKYTSSNHTTLKQIATDSNGKWSGDLKIKIDTESNYFKGSGNYVLRLDRFTSSGSKTSSDNSIILIVASSSSPTPTSQPSFTQTATPSPTPQPTPTKPPSYFNITNTPSKINSNQSFGIPVSLQLPDNPNTKFYLKGAFQKVGSTNYFGQTKVDNNWIKNLSNYSSQKSIQTDNSGQWSGNLEIQPDISDSGYQGTGVYVFKVARYTSTGSGPTWSNDANIEIIGESQTFSPTPQPSTETQASESPIINTSKNQTAQIPEYIKSENILSATYAPSPSLQPEINIAEDKSINWYFVLAGITGLFTLSVLIYFLKGKKFAKLLKHDI